jgi:hypothetical protein
MQSAAAVWLSVAKHSRIGLISTKPVPVIAAEEARQRAHAMKGAGMLMCIWAEGLD